MRFVKQPRYYCENDPRSRDIIVRMTSEIIKLAVQNNNLASEFIPLFIMNDEIFEILEDNGHF